MHTNNDRTSTPQVLNKRHDGVPPGSIYIGRGSKWGNPYVIPYDGDRSQVIEKYLEHLLASPGLYEEAVTELRGKDLVCFCAPLPCHGDFLLQIANTHD